MLHGGTDSGRIQHANLSDTRCVHLEILKAGGIVVTILSHCREQESLIIHTGWHTHLVIYRHHRVAFLLGLCLSLGSLLIIVSLGIGIILTLIILPIGTDGSATELVTCLAGKTDTTGDMAHGERDALGGARYRYPITYGVIRIVTALAIGIQHISQVAAPPGTETHNTSVFPSE